MGSELKPYHSEIDYKAVNRGEELYDQYDIKLDGFQLSMIDELTDSKNWEKANTKVDIINEISINVYINRALEPNHPKFPGIELFCQIHNIDIYFSPTTSWLIFSISKPVCSQSKKKRRKRKKKKNKKTSRKKKKRKVACLTKLIRN